jgi:hypothetical protein
MALPIIAVQSPQHSELFGGFHPFCGDLHI